MKTTTTWPASAALCKAFHPVHFSPSPLMSAPCKKHMISGIKPSYTSYYKLVLLNRALSESPQFTSLDKEIPLRDPFQVQQGPLKLQRKQSSS